MWFLDNGTYMEPSLKYGQFERGKGRMNPSGIMDAHDLPYLIDAIGMLETLCKMEQDHTAGNGIMV